MSSRPVAITASGLVTGVGLDALSTCAAIRATIDNFQETRFVDANGEWIQGCTVQLDDDSRGIRKLARMLSMARARDIPTRQRRLQLSRSCIRGLGGCPAPVPPDCGQVPP